MGTVRKMLSMAETKPGEVVYDLGSGDGRIITAAAREFHARSVGIEINPLWVVWAQLVVSLLDLDGQVRVVWGNFFRKDLSEADIVTLFLKQDTNDRLEQKLKRELKRGARVVSHAYTLSDWSPREINKDFDIFLYEIDGSVAESHTTDASKLFC